MSDVVRVKKIIFTKDKNTYVNLRDISNGCTTFDFCEGLKKIGESIGAKVFPINAVSNADLCKAYLSLWESTRLAALFKHRWEVLWNYAVNELNKAMDFTYPHDVITCLSVDALCLLNIPQRTINDLNEIGCLSIGDIFINCRKMESSAKAMGDVFWALKDIMYDDEAAFFKDAIINHALATHKKIPDFIKATM